MRKMIFNFILERMISKCAFEHLSRNCREVIVWYHLTATELCSSFSALNKKEMKFEYSKSA